MDDVMLPDAPARAPDRVAELERENTRLRAEIRIAREAAELTAQLVVRQFEEFERVLNLFQEANAERQAVLDAAAQMSIIAADLDGTIRLFNRGAETLLGWRAGEMVGCRSLLDVHVAAELRERGRRLAPEGEAGGEVGGLDVLRRLALGGDAAASEWSYRRKDGTTLPVNLSVTVLRDADREITGYLAVAMDLTERKRAEDEVARYSTYLSTVLESLPQGVSVFDAELRLVLWNTSYLQVMDLPDTLVRRGLPLAEILRFNAERGEYGPGDTEDYVLARLESASRFESVRYERLRPNGRTLDIQSRPMRMGGRTVGLVVTHTDITETKKAEDAVRRANELMEDAIAYSPTFVWEIDHKGVFTFVQGCQKVLGYTPEEMRGRHFNEFRCRAAGCRDLRAAVDGALRSFKAFDRLPGCALNKSGGHVWLSMSAHPIYDRHGVFAGYRGVNMDVTELTNAKEELERIALHDTLTGLANRRKFMDAFHIESARQRRSDKPLSLLVVDIDHFKQVNDHYGHLTGDVCLKCVAAVLEGCVRAHDLAARFGGEEFIVLLPETDLEGALLTAERLRQAVAALDVPVEGQTKLLKVTVSIGVATRTAADADDSFDDLMEVADAGLYAAKRGGRNRVCLGE